ncbi:TIGR02117 family protein [Stakelama saccharophila]|uniref:TIGR02117 family protein n=1 Tax=Stakelama saccharophila TaxID=3075605 RepID=A0ABZ0BB59_9SPHN|nr:TIGR02117 family protein [Stakelama sp. W311]WNO54437.1 TIGR02117 family protein [Stakelama sp. W311]
MLCLAYGLAGLVGGAIPVNTGRVAPERGIRVYVADNGIHTDIVLPVTAGGNDWRDLLRPEDLADPRYAAHPYVAFGWGDRAFYVGTPTWSDLDLATVLRAATGSDDTVLHVEHVPRPLAGPDIRALTLRPDEYRRLVRYVRASFRVGADGRAGSVRGYGPHDAFYDARGHYDAVHTCNEWTGRALRRAGVRTGWWTPFSDTVMWWLR